ncbi:hypothetical protein UPYG_G00229640 [Umbra pygmaea]|uniref:IQ domain-containing protein C n=1 Tax=Umbra pygmaea TaxID=75934 RepID=A0ABD0WEU1_UMBPY
MKSRFISREYYVTIVMEGSEWLNTFTHFQAHARGYLVRKEVKSACSEFEDIVRSIDGDVTHMDWKGHVIPRPHFKDIDGPLQKCGAFTKKAAQNQGARDPAMEQPGETEAGLLTVDRMEPERDSQGQASASGGEEDVKGNVEQPDGGGLRDSIGDETNVWSSLVLDSSCSHFHKGSKQRRTLAQDVPQTPEGLKLHRNSLAMEMLWLQQAIASRKKYLSLKERLNMS